MATLSFHPEHHGDITTLLEPINPKDFKAYLTFIIDKQQCQVLSGQGADIQSFTFPIEKEWRLKPGQWMLCASSFKEYWAKQEVLIANKESFSIEVSYDEDKILPKISTLTAIESHIYIQAQPALDEHLTFQSLVQASQSNTVPTESAKTILEIAETYVPYQVFELNKEERVIKVERDNKKIPYALPEGIEPQFSLTLDKESAEQLQKLCNKTTSQQISIYTDDERAVFSDGIRTYSSSLLPLQEYRLKTEVHFNRECQILVDIYQLNYQIRSFKKQVLLKRANEALLYVDDDHVMIAGLVPETGEARFITTQKIQVKAPHLYRINLSEMSKIRIDDITDAKSIELQVLKSTQGEYKLGYFNNRNNAHPYASVYDIAPAPEAMKAVLAVKEVLEKSLNHSGEQGDMLGYDDL